MRPTAWTAPCSTIAVVSVLFAAVVSFAEPPRGLKNESSTDGTSDSTDDLDDRKRVSVEVARKRAKLTHNIYAATLDVIHHHYFRGDRSSVPARAMEDVFSEIARQENIKAKWIAVNAKAMSIDHRPESYFEKQAAKALAAGNHEYELVKDGIYHRAETISLMNRGCLGCHLGFGVSSTKERFAGLVITIPVTKD